MKPVVVWIRDIADGLRIAMAGTAVLGRALCAKVVTETALRGTLLERMGLLEGKLPT